MPIPRAAPVGPSIAQQLDGILSAGQVPPTTASDLSRIQPFVYRPADGGGRVRSVTPVSMEIPRPLTVPVVLSAPVRPIRPAMRPRERFEPDYLRDTTVEPLPENVHPDVPRTQEQERFHVPQPVFVRYKLQI